MQIFDPPTTDIQAAILYADCRHGWRVKIRDWIRFRRHPATHLIHYSPIYNYFVGQMKDNPIDLDQDTIRVSFDSRGIFKIEEPNNENL